MDSGLPSPDPGLSLLYPVTSFPNLFVPFLPLNNSHHLLSAYYVPRTNLDTLHLPLLQRLPRKGKGAI